MRLRMRAWTETAWRNPAASYITIPANTAETANSGALIPKSRPIAVVSDVTNAECALGIPPVLTM